MSHLPQAVRELCLHLPDAIGVVKLERSKSEAKQAGASGVGGRWTARRRNRFRLVRRLPRRHPQFRCKLKIASG